MLEDEQSRFDLILSIVRKAINMFKGRKNKPIYLSDIKKRMRLRAKMLCIAKLEER